MAKQDTKTELIGKGVSQYQLITPPNNLKNKVRPLRARPGQPIIDPVAAAEREMQKLAPQFSLWMEDDINRLKKAWVEFETKHSSDEPVTADSIDTLFRISHDIKGQAGTYGLPYAATVASSLCLITENEGALSRVPFSLIEQHVNAISAIFREADKPHGKKLAFALTEELSKAVHSFLSKEL
ncbi:MAG: hypothetical protein COA52_06630 [Hyphomicrobiales bacterium]|nr:MAG: hypothetical protein COA52_06630 [Hyphomicrobiales bacterium]